MLTMRGEISGVEEWKRMQLTLQFDCEDSQVLLLLDSRLHLDAAKLETTAGLSRTFNLRTATLVNFEIDQYQSD